MYKKLLKNIRHAKIQRDDVLDLYKNMGSGPRSVHNREPHFIFSAEKPIHPDENKFGMDHAKTLDFLKNKGYEVEEIEGKYGDTQKSILVHNPPKHTVKHLQNLAAGLGQESSIYSDGYNHELHYHHGENAGKHIKGQGTHFPKRQPDDFYSTLADGVHFSHNLNFDTLHPPKESMLRQSPTPINKNEGGNKPPFILGNSEKHPLEDSSPDLNLIHYSPAVGLKTIDPSFHGVRGIGEETKQGQPRHPTSFFYLEGTAPEGTVASGSKYKYIAKTRGMKFYDIAKDPDKFKDMAKANANKREINRGVVDRDDIDELIKEHGYHGIYNSGSATKVGRGIVGIYHPIPVEASHHLHSNDFKEASATNHHENDRLLDFSKPPETHEGHTFDLKPKLLKSYFGMVIDLLKNRNNYMGVSLIVLDDESLDLIKADGPPSYAGEQHRDKPYIAVKHPKTGQLMWHHNRDLSDKNDQIINSSHHIRGLLDKIPSTRHKQAMLSVIDSVSKDPYRHLVPTEFGGKHQLRARHIKSLLLGHDNVKMDTTDPNKLSIIADRHGSSSGQTTKWDYNLKQGKVEKNEKTTELHKERIIKFNATVRLDGSLLKRAGSPMATKKAQNKEFGLGVNSDGYGLDLKKGTMQEKIKTGLASVAIAASTLGMMATDPNKTQPSTQKNVINNEDNSLQTSLPKLNTTKDKTLYSIAQVESNNGTNVNHARLPSNSIHEGSSAYGTYGLTPILIRETIKKNPQFKQHQNALSKLKSFEVSQYMKQNPELERQIASSHYDRLAKKFGHDPVKIGYGWLMGITRTNQALKQKQNLHDHWHVQKILKNYNKIK